MKVTSIEEAMKYGFRKDLYSPEYILKLPHDNYEDEGFKAQYLYFINPINLTLNVRFDIETMTDLDLLVVNERVPDVFIEMIRDGVLI